MWLFFLSWVSERKKSDHFRTILTLGLLSLSLFVAKWDNNYKRKIWGNCVSESLNFESVNNNNYTDFFVFREREMIWWLNYDNDDVRPYRVSNSVCVCVSPLV